MGNKVTMKAAVKGGQGTLKYQFSYKYAGKTVVLSDFSTKSSAVFHPKKSGTYTLYVKVKDESGQLAVKTIKSYKVLKKYAIDTLKVSGKNKKLQIKIGTVGAEGTVKYKYVVKHNGEVVKKSTFNTKKAYTVKVKKKGTYTVTVYAKDTASNVVKKKTVKCKIK